MREESPQPTSGAPRWAPVLAAATWLAATAAAGLFLAYLGFWSTVEFFGEQPTADDFREAAGYAAGAGLFMALGPFGIWLARRTRPWLVAAAVLFMLGMVWAASALIRSFGAAGR